MARTRMVRRWRRNMEVRDDVDYVNMLATLSEGSVRRNFNPYTDIDWDSAEFAVTDNDPRWILPTTDPLEGVRQFAAACGVEPTHSRQVTRLAMQLFARLREPLGLTPADGRLLEAAAILHEVGYVINYEKHHQHSYHLIMHGNLRGLGPREREVVANVARYHTRSVPKRRHPNFARLSAAEQRVAALTPERHEAARMLEEARQAQADLPDIAGLRAAARSGGVAAPAGRSKRPDGSRSK